MTEAGLRKIGLYGGTFDPVHLGHFIVAQDAHEHLALDHVYFVPAAQAPLRHEGPIATGAERASMIEGGIAQGSPFSVLRDEIECGGVSYTIDTVRSLRERFTGVSLYLIIGADQLGKLDRWRAIDELAQKVEFAVIARPGHPLEAPASLRASLRLHRLSPHPFGISSTEIRERLRSGLPVNYFLAEATLRQIQENQTYSRPRQSELSPAETYYN
jgi:nicotinate-nucleotide adenylyltransferase